MEFLPIYIIINLQFASMGKFEFIKENLDETVFVFALFKCRKFDKRRN